LCGIVVKEPQTPFLENQLITAVKIAATYWGESNPQRIDNNENYYSKTTNSATEISQ
jgi:hypothetical protein